MRPNPLETADLVTFTEEILDGKLRFLCSVEGEEVFRTFYENKHHITNKMY